MAECPVCNSRLQIQKPYFPLSLFMKDKFICPACDWEMPISEVHKRGGLNRIMVDIANGNPNGSSRHHGGHGHHKHHRSRHHRHRHHRR